MTLKETSKKISKLLQKPLVVFDLETSGLDCNTGEILQFWGVRIDPSGKNEELSFLAKNEKDIDAKASEIHGLTTEKLKGEKPFKHFVPKLQAFFKDADMGGYNCQKFDCEYLASVLSRYDVKGFMENRRVIDSYKVYKKDHRRQLADCYKFYCDKDLEKAHDASCDGEATLEILLSQLEKHQCDVGGLMEKFGVGSDDELSKYLIKENGEWVFNFSKHKGTKLSEVDKTFLTWINNKDFPKCLKETIKPYLK